MKAPLFSETIVVFPYSTVVSDVIGSAVRASISAYQRSPVDIDDRSRRKADRHEGQDLPRDIFALADAADGQAGCRLGEHVAAGGFRHGRANRRIDDPGRDGVDAHR